jgi:hypothetical protein
MKAILKSLPILLAIFLKPFSAQAYWPTTADQNLSVAAQPDTAELECQAIIFPDDATLVVFRKQWYGNQYQIIDRYGQLKYSFPQYLTPGNPSYWVTEPHLISDGDGGAFVAWKNAFQGIIAQRLDSLGNIMWGDSGKVISPFIETDFDISTDGQGGFFLALSRDTSLYCEIRVQRINSDGDTLWGNQGIWITGYPYGGELPKVTHGSQGDAYVVWYDWRPPYSNWGAVFAQRLNSNGQRMWPNDLFIGEHSYGHKVISDGQGGIILQANPGTTDYNKHYHISPAGTILWQRDHLSWYHWAEIVEGEPGYFYLGYEYYESTYGQRVRISDGTSLWGVGQTGAVVASLGDHTGPIDFKYIYPNLYGVYGFESPGNITKNFYGQALDSLGNRLIGQNGVLMCSIPFASYYQYTNVVPDNNEGLVFVFEHVYDYDVWAKRANLDGTLGGPYPPIAEVNIVVEDSSTVLTWPAQSDSAIYHIYISPEPYNFPAIPDTTISDTCYIDIGVVSEGAWFYRVTWEP